MTATKPPRRRIRSLSGTEAFDALKEIERETGTRIRLKLSDRALRELLRTIQIAALGDPEVARLFARWRAAACDYCMRPILGAREAILSLRRELLDLRPGLTYLPGAARKFWNISHLGCAPNPWHIYRLDTLEHLQLELPWDVSREIEHRREAIEVAGRAAEKEARRHPKLRVFDLEAGTLEEFG
jgi:hypothetical protein